MARGLAILRWVSLCCTCRYIIARDNRVECAVKRSAMANWAVTSNLFCGAMQAGGVVSYVLWYRSTPAGATHFAPSKQGLVAFCQHTEAR